MKFDVSRLHRLALAAVAAALCASPAARAALPNNGLGNNGLGNNGLGNNGLGNNGLPNNGLGNNGLGNNGIGNNGIGNNGLGNNGLGNNGLGNNGLMVDEALDVAIFANRAIFTAFTTNALSCANLNNIPAMNQVFSTQVTDTGVMPVSSKWVQYIYKDVHAANEPPCIVKDNFHTPAWFQPIALVGGVGLCAQTWGADAGLAGDARCRQLLSATLATQMNQSGDENEYSLLGDSKTGAPHRSTVAGGWSDEDALTQPSSAVPTWAFVFRTDNLVSSLQSCTQTDGGTLPASGSTDCGWQAGYSYRCHVGDVDSLSLSTTATTVTGSIIPVSIRVSQGIMGSNSTDANKMGEATTYSPTTVPTSNTVASVKFTCPASEVVNFQYAPYNRSDLARLLLPGTNQHSQLNVTASNLSAATTAPVATYGYTSTWPVGKFGPLPSNEKQVFTAAEMSVKADFFQAWTGDATTWSPLNPAFNRNACQVGYDTTGRALNCTSKGTVELACAVTCTGGSGAMARMAANAQVPIFHGAEWLDFGWNTQQSYYLARTCSRNGQACIVPPAYGDATNTRDAPDVNSVERPLYCKSITAHLLDGGSNPLDSGVATINTLQDSDVCNHQTYNVVNGDFEYGGSTLGATYGWALDGGATVVAGEAPTYAATTYVGNAIQLGSDAATTTVPATLDSAPLVVPNDGIARTLYYAENTDCAGNASAGLNVTVDTIAATGAVTHSANLASVACPTQAGWAQHIVSLGTTYNGKTIKIHFDYHSGITASLATIDNVFLGNDDPNYTVTTFFPTFYPGYAIDASIKCADTRYGACWSFGYTYPPPLSPK